MGRATTALAIAASALLATSAGAEWKRVHGGGSDYLLSVSVTPGGGLFAGGFTLDQGSQLPLPKAALFASDDRGANLDPIVGSLGGGIEGFGAVAIVGAIAFADASTGLVVTDSTVNRTSDRGATWQTAALTADVRDIHLFDANTGIAVGDGGLVARTEDGGATWTAQPSGTTVDLRCAYWLDADRGFAAGHATSSETDFEGQDTTIIGEGVVLATTDGGRTWTKGHTTSGLVLCPLFFLPNGTDGWLAAAADAEEGHGTAKLLATTDGGATFTDMAVPVQVGTMKMFIEAKVQASTFTTMFWADPMTGHLGGSAYITEVSGGGSPKPIFRTVDFLTRDGGATWEKTDLGTVELNIMGGQTPSGDGATLDGHMASLLDGVMVGESTGVWVYQGGCAVDADCGPNATCGGGLCTTNEPPAQGCAGTDCSGPAGGGTVGGASDDATSGPGGSPGGVAPTASGEGGGCRATTRTGGQSLALGMLGLCLGALAHARNRKLRSRVKKT